MINELTPDEQAAYDRHKLFSRMAAREAAEQAAKVETEKAKQQSPPEAEKLSYLDQIAANLLAQKQQHNGRGLVSR